MFPTTGREGRPIPSGSVRFQQHGSRPCRISGPTGAVAHRMDGCKGTRSWVGIGASQGAVIGAESSRGSHVIIVLSLLGSD